MSGFAERKKRNQTILCVAFVIAIGIHVMAIYALKDMKMDFYSVGKAFLENPKAILSPETLAKRAEEVQKRNQQLADAFRELVKKPIDPPDNTQILPEVNMEFLGMQLEDMSIPEGDEKVLALQQESVEDTIDHWHDLEKAATTLESPKVEQKHVFDLISPSLVSLENLQPHDEEVAEELVRATEAVQGLVTAIDVEEISTSPGIKVGAIETSPVIGNSIAMQPGFLDVGKEDTLARMPTMILEGNDADQYKKEVTQFLSKKANLHLDGQRSLTDKDRQELLAFPQKEASSGSATSETTVLASSEHFTMNVEYAKPMRGEGYLFRLELVPKANVSFKPIAQNYYFLIDRSNSIGPNRYEASKAAVVKALKFLRKGDTFNIIVFDNEATRLSETNLPWGLVNFLRAQEFLKNQKPGGMFATTDLYTSLHSIVPNEVAENEVNTAILMSDGDTYLSAEEQRNTIGQWTHQNGGKVSLFCVGIQQGDNVPLMDLLSSFNKGSVQCADRLESLDQTLLSLMKKLQNPIGKSITATVIAKDPKVKVILLPSNHRMPNLYQDTPYVIYGKINQLKDFHIFFQGRYFDKWLDIKQAVSFKNAKDVSSDDLERTWSLQSAYYNYDRYLHDRDVAHLNRAKKLLAPYKIVLPFQ